MNRVLIPYWVVGRHGQRAMSGLARPRPVGPTPLLCRAWHGPGWPGPKKKNVFNSFSFVSSFWFSVSVLWDCDGVFEVRSRSKMSSEIEVVEEGPAAVTGGVGGGVPVEEEVLRNDVYTAVAYGDLEKLQRLVEVEGYSVSKPDGLVGLLGIYRRL